MTVSDPVVAGIIIAALTGAMVETIRKHRQHSVIQKVLAVFSDRCAVLCLTQTD